MTLKQAVQALNEARLTGQLKGASRRAFRTTEWNIFLTDEVRWPSGGRTCVGGVRCGRGGGRARRSRWSRWTIAQLEQLRAVSGVICTGSSHSTRAVEHEED